MYVTVPNHSFEKFVEVAVFAPLPMCFEYGLNAEQAATATVGARIFVPFGSSRRVGVIRKVLDSTTHNVTKIKPISELLDAAALLPDKLETLLERAGQYYHHPLGEVFAAALPSRIRAGQPVKLPEQTVWQITPAGLEAELSTLNRAPKQQNLLRHLRESEKLPPFTASDRSAFKRLVELGYAEAVNTLKRPALPKQQTAVTLSAEQQQTVDQLAKSHGFAVNLLFGVTGSGKTEIYLALMAEQLQAGKQILLLVPEINLTPQLLDRVTARLAARIVLLHSGLTDHERAEAWALAKAGHIDVVIGTRSAIFTPLAEPGLIIVDEEHDSSFKQQDGFRYSARDLAVMRGQLDQHPVLLGSATPALETLHNVATGRYRQVKLEQRAGSAKPPKLRFIDLMREGCVEGFSPSALGAMDAHLEAGNQVVVFLNRRGYAPLLLCNACGWQADCPHCSAHLTLHQRRGRLTCHHCGFETRPPHTCPDCGSIDLGDVGQGTERIEAILSEKFPQYGLVRIDSDTVRGKSGLAASRDKVLSGEAKILIGTQLLAKGHHFPDVTLVVMLDLDGMLKSPDPRATEQTAQMIIQVAGRAGRGELSGEVLLQTRYPEHPLLQTLLYQGYTGFAKEELAQRQAANMPPFTRMALLRCEASDKSAIEAFLEEAKTIVVKQQDANIQLMGPATAMMERRNGRFRMQLIINAVNRIALQHQLQQLMPQLYKLPLARKVRWSLDVDPVDFR